MELSQDVAVLAVTVHAGGLEHVEPGGNDDGAHAEGLLLYTHVQVYGAHRAGLRDFLGVLAALLVKVVDTGQTLVAGYVNCLPLAEAEVELVGRLALTYLGAHAAAYTLVLVYVPRLRLDDGAEVTHDPDDPLEAAQRVNLYVGVLGHWAPVHAAPVKLPVERRDAVAAVQGRETGAELRRLTA